MAHEADDGRVSNEILTALKARVPQDRYKTVVSTLDLFAENTVLE